MNAAFWLMDALLAAYGWLIVASVIVSWLVEAGIVNGYNRWIVSARDLSERLLEPLLSPIRRRVGIVGGFDLSPLILLAGVWFVRVLLREDVRPMLS